ncbi:hypothetical protein F5Y07DRAFT_368413 [Xylaria sp. FL0933]|nr:hypothetical protein F5Y07DRAFT_368413 [Xylaria sp. FL0933]
MYRWVSTPHPIGATRRYPNIPSVSSFSASLFKIGTLNPTSSFAPSLYQADVSLCHSFRIPSILRSTHQPHHSIPCSTQPKPRMSNILKDTLSSIFTSTKREQPKVEDDSLSETRINSKYIPHPRMLKEALEEKLGKKQFEFEMRQNVYIIKSQRQLSVSDLAAAVQRQDYPA